ncbi:MLO-like protein 10, partial [Cucurbita argyrosperma subsp. sororia]
MSVSCLLFTGAALVSAAGGGDGGGHSRELDNTPTWDVAGVCFFFIVISVVLEKVIQGWNEHSIHVPAYEDHEPSDYEDNPLATPKQGDEFSLIKPAPLK